MKNDAIRGQANAELPEAWREALVLLDQDLRRRGSAEGTRALYGADVEELARWAVPYALAPADVDYPWLRRYAAKLAERGLAPRTVARKLAGLRACFRVLVEHGVMTANPAELLASPKLPQRLPRALAPADVAALLDRIPASTPLEIRDRALFELAYACGLRAEELIGLDVGSLDFDAEQVRVEGKGGKTRFVPVGEHALAALTRYLERARGALDAGTGEPALFLSKTGRRLSTSGAACGRGRGRPRRRAPCTRTGCDIHLRLIFWTEVPIYGPSKPCWVTRPYPPPRSTLG
jgi:site-specific recombinase XerD